MRPGARRFKTALSLSPRSVDGLREVPGTHSGAEVVGGRRRANWLKRKRTSSIAANMASATYATRSILRSSPMIAIG